MMQRLKTEFRIDLELIDDELNITYDDADPDATDAPPGFPLSFQTRKTIDKLLIPLGEGMSFPSGDEICITDGCRVNYQSYMFLLSMPWYGVTDGEIAMMFVVSDPADSNIGISKSSNG
ncbi:hypothetical protein GPJ56_009050 [Histomonas meleagridis]|uniref:uncharacterized protein n=1 Tax=Histomonas meleagridis TaxID=135588 RepID=UPI0035595687|nr:hypothetical protein GPJ56_009050 [Histomonas meleagridis]KAH0799295.1 hypothetical protein GO595_008092 [Histomonas meleagridis]